MHSPSDDVRAADLSRHRAYNGAAVSGEGPLTLRAAAPQWSYVLELEAPDLADDPDSLYTAGVKLTVIEGSISAGTLRPDGMTFVDERTIRQGADVVCELVAGSRADCRGVMLRTVNDRPAVVRIDSVRWVRIRHKCGDFFTTPARTELTPVPQWNRYYGPHGTPVERLRGFCYDRLDEPSVVPWLFGRRIVIHPKEQMSKAVFVSGLYEPATLIALRQFAVEGAVMIDAGANAGWITLACSAWVGAAGRVMAFEPSRREYERLAEHVRLNGLTNVETYPAALGASPGVGELRVADGQYSGLNTLGDRLAYDGVAVARIEPVEVDTIDAFAARRGLTRLDVMKLDVEGAELDVLRGAAETIRRFRPAIVFEAFAPALAAHGHTTGELGDFIASLGYDLFRIGDDGTLEAASVTDAASENFVAVSRS
jgi:FkbM family methyltransferase